MSSSDATLSWRSLATVLALLAASLAGLLAAAPIASAAGPTYVSGPIAVDTTWVVADSPFVVVGDVTVKAGVTLAIDPGVEVRFNPSRSLYVEGTLLGDGLPGTEIIFRANVSMIVLPWMGVQFNASSGGSVTYSTFERVERAVTAIDSSPYLANNVVFTSGVGFALIRSASAVQDNTILRASLYGVYVNASNAVVQRNAINDTSIGVYVIEPGASFVGDNVITNVSGLLAFGIYVAGGADAYLGGNVIAGVFGARGPDGIGAGAAGSKGAPAVGILVDGPATSVILGNSISSVYGGRGGDGRENIGLTGGRGGDGGPAAGIAIGAGGTADIQWNSIGSIFGGRGGNGGGLFGTALGGNGGTAGEAVGISVSSMSVSVSLLGNGIDGLQGGGGGSGGDATADGNGGLGGAAAGILASAVRDADASGNAITNLVGGSGGNSTPVGIGNGAGALGGEATGIGFIGPQNTSILHSNFLWMLTGGEGGRGSSGGDGGNATGAFVFGNNDGTFNATTASSNWIQSVTGGLGGLGNRVGGDGGSVAGLGFALSTPASASNLLWILDGGDGGDSLDGSDGGAGGYASAFVAYLVRDATSVEDSIDTVTKGVVGAGPPAKVSYGGGYYAAGAATARTRLDVENATLSNVGDFDFYVDNYTETTTISTAFDGAAVAVQAAGNLTVKNYLEVDILWPDGLTPVAGASILVEDNGATAYSLTSASGSEPWLLVTDRVYINSNLATENDTDVTVGYLAYNFLSNPRAVSMAADTVEAFVMVDEDAPASAADPQPSYRNTATFEVSYTASDGSGVGLSTITLWYRKDGAGWTPDQTQAAAASGNFTFTASGDGVYEFATQAEDLDGNREPDPVVNDTWTILDTQAPGSAVAALSLWQNASSFVVSWAPDPGVTDIATYTIQYDRGAGWTTWLSGTNLTSDTFTGATTGVYQFRSLATDFAGNVETPPAGNDTYTRVDLAKPFSRVRPLTPWQTATDFAVTWEPQFDTFDIATYRIEVNDDGTGWTVWIASTASTSATFSGTDGHTYQFRSIATDFAGNVETPPAGNDTYTRVDVTPPASAVDALPLYTTSASVSLSWDALPGTTDIAVFTIQVSDDGGPWTNVAGLVNTTAKTGTFSGVDGHVYAFRSLARDLAGNVEGAGAGNETYTILDLSAPTTGRSLGGTPGSNGWYRNDVTVTLTATDATSGVAATEYRVDGGSWQTYAGAFAVSSDGLHTVQYYSTDVAGNTETTTSFQLRVDSVGPTSSASLDGTAGSSGSYLSTVVVTLTASDATSGVSSISYRVDGGSWQTYASPFVIGTDGTHAVEYYATDDSGLSESARTAGFLLDTARPVVSNAAPRGANTNATPSIVITFSEPMDRTSVEQAFSLSPDTSGTFSWSADSRVLTFVADRPLEYGTAYFVSLDSTARDAAGNTIGSPYSFQFTTVAAPTLSVGDYWWLILAVIAAAGAAFFLMRKRAAAAETKPATPPAATTPKEEPAVIDDVFLLHHRDGLLIKHETRRLKPDIDTDILSGMLTAVQQFVKDSFRTEEGELDELTFGQMHILIGRGKWLIVAAMVTGGSTIAFTEQIKRCIEDMEKHQWDQLEDWDGDMAIAKVLTPYLKKLIRGEYA